MTQASMALALSGFSFLLTVIWGEPLLRILRQLKIGEHIRIEGPRSHFAKLGTPTMGGVLILFPVALLTILFNAVKVLGVSIFGNSILVPLMVFVAYALIGSIDDWFSLRGIRRGDGLSPISKLILQLVVAIAGVFVLRYVLDVPELYLPGLDFEISLGIFYFP
ncbi:MAG: phospho-N-acetylmuramoyl-pentapeptide-transferase, partial [Anaerolineales bacterium]